MTVVLYFVLLLFLGEKTPRKIYPTYRQRAKIPQKAWISGFETLNNYPEVESVNFSLPKGKLYGHLLGLWKQRNPPCEPIPFIKPWQKTIHLKNIITNIMSILEISYLLTMTSIRFA